jgi:hypothetical protein
MRVREQLTLVRGCALTISTFSIGVLCLMVLLCRWTFIAWSAEMTARTTELTAWTAELTASNGEMTARTAELTARIAMLERGIVEQAARNAVAQNLLNIATKCPVCFVAEKDRMLLCGHRFCVDCIREVEERALATATATLRLCPVCREQFVAGEGTCSVPRATP